jgi:hypothetical protein
MYKSQQLFSGCRDLDGILRCVLCGELFQDTANIRSLIVLLRARAAPIPIWLDEKIERTRRFDHAMSHAKRGEVVRDDAGIFRLPPEPTPTAQAFGFRNESVPVEDDASEADAPRMYEKYPL